MMDFIKHRALKNISAPTRWPWLDPDIFKRDKSQLNSQAAGNAVYAYFMPANGVMLILSQKQNTKYLDESKFISVIYYTSNNFCKVFIKFSNSKYTITIDVAGRADTYVDVTFVDPVPVKNQHGQYRRTLWRTRTAWPELNIELSKQNTTTDDKTNL